MCPGTWGDAIFDQGNIRSHDSLQICPEIIVHVTIALMDGPSQEDSMKVDVKRVNYVLFYDFETPETLVKYYNCLKFQNATFVAGL